GGGGGGRTPPPVPPPSSVVTVRGGMSGHQQFPKWRAFWRADFALPVATPHMVFKMVRRHGSLMHFSAQSTTSQTLPVFTSRSPISVSSLSNLSRQSFAVSSASDSSPGLEGRLQ